MPGAAPTSKKSACPAQVEWAIAAAARLGVALDASLADLAHMQSLRLHSYKDLRLDDGITGADLTRPGFLAVSADALSHKAISHLFIYKRDRFARPQDAMQAAQIEKRLLTAGITIVFSDTVSAPIRLGEQTIMRDLELLLPYYQGGEELRKHAERVLGFQKVLAEGGFRVGGNAPYGFVRVLVDNAGKVLEELPPGKTVRQPGCHVRVVPKDAQKIATWLQILEWKAQGWGVKRIAQALNQRGIPSPDAGRTRTDHGVKHRVSGRWSVNTVVDLCRNASILGIQEYGKRSEGKIRRLGPDGHRAPGRGTRFHCRRPRSRHQQRPVVAHPQAGGRRAIRLPDVGGNSAADGRARAQPAGPAACPRPGALPVGLPPGGPDRWLRRDPLWPHQPAARGLHVRPLHANGRAECASNQVDAEAMLRFTLLTLKQFVDRHGRRDKLRQKLLERALREGQESARDPRRAELARLQARQTELQGQHAIIEYRMARERDDALYAALSRQYQAIQADLAAVAESIRQQETAEATVESRSPEAQVEGALALLDDVARITADPAARAEINPLLKRLGLWIGLQFRPSCKGQDTGGPAAGKRPDGLRRRPAAGAAVRQGPGRGQAVRLRLHSRRFPCSGQFGDAGDA